MIPLRQSTASQEIPLGHFLDSTDGDTEEGSLTIANTDIKLWMHGATTLANKNSGGATYISNGVYYCVLDATDTATLGGLTIFVHVSGALATRVDCHVFPANVFDSLYSTDRLEVDISQCGGSPVAAGAIPNAAADAAGGLPVSDVGGLDIDTKLANTDDIGVAGVGLTNLGGMSSGMQTEVNNQVVDVVRTDTTSEMSQGAPPSTPTMEEMIAYIYFSLRNKNVETSTEHQVFDDAGTTILFKADMADSAGVLTKSEYVSGV